MPPRTEKATDDRDDAYVHGFFLGVLILIRGVPPAAKIGRWTQFDFGNTTNFAEDKAVTTRWTLLSIRPSSDAGRAIWRTPLKSGARAYRDCAPPDFSDPFGRADIVPEWRVGSHIGGPQAHGAEAF